MKMRSKVILVIAALFVIVLLFGNDDKPKEESSNASEQVLVASADEPEAKTEPDIEIANSLESKSAEATIPEKILKEESNTSDSNEIDNNTGTQSQLEVHYIDVGQGDAILITCGGEAMLVDAGDESKGTAVQLYLKNHNIKQLKYVMATHPDADHIGGLDVIVYKYDCGQVFIPNCSNDTPSFDQLQYSLKAKGYSPHIVDIGEKYTIGDAQFELLSPSSEFVFSDTNDSSIVFRLDHGDNSFLFTGDATIPPQQALIYDPDLNIDVDVIKVPHHGASSAYIKGFYDEVSPEYAVISCGRGNSYGHPRQEVLDDLRNRGTKLYRTDEQGTVVAVSDGKTITFNLAPSVTWLPGEIDDTGKSGNEADNSVTREFQHDLSESPEDGVTYVYNKNTMKFHYPNCSSVTDMSPKNREDLYCSREELLQLHPEAKPCKRCKP